MCMYGNLKKYLSMDYINTKYVPICIINMYYIHSLPETHMLNSLLAYLEVFMAC